MKYSFTFQQYSFLKFSANFVDNLFTHIFEGCFRPQILLSKFMNLVLWLANLYEVS